ncbi:peptidoglycan-recognition protein SA-like isoform X2 [Maniola hyperantus]|uniref:peptidoglycan-recognition protein SA-like isoform X2 n=1 Tax=Aphantopus hyperantus TaxID=2795564 RepID=UPI0021426779
MSLGSEYDFNLLWDYNHQESDDEEDLVRNIFVTATEETPLLDPPSNEPSVNNQHIGIAVVDYTTIVLLVVALLGGISIGIYLLVLQYNQDHTLPPVEDFPALQINKSLVHQPGEAGIVKEPFHAETVIIEQTGTGECFSLESCVPVLREIKEKFGSNDSLPYNFLVASDGTAYEGLGWSKLSPLNSDLKPLFLAFIGNFVKEAPTFEQIAMTKTLITDFLEKNLLAKNYTVKGNLFDKFKDVPQWKKIKSG